MAVAVVEGGAVGMATAAMAAGTGGGGLLCGFPATDFRAVDSGVLGATGVLCLSSEGFLCWVVGVDSDAGFGAGSGFLDIGVVAADSAFTSSDLSWRVGVVGEATAVGFGSSSLGACSHMTESTNNLHCVNIFGATCISGSPVPGHSQLTRNVIGYEDGGYVNGMIVRVSFLGGGGGGGGAPRIPPLPPPLPPARN